AAGYYQPTQQGGTNQAEQEEAERRKKEEQALHASNVALDLRGNRHNQDPERLTAPGPARSDRGTSRAIAEQASDSPVTPSNNTRESKTAAYDSNSADGKMYRLFEGHIIET